MARPKNTTRTIKVSPSIPVTVHAMLQHLAGGLYGANPTAVAHYLITRGLDDLVRAGVLPPEEPPLKKK
jgi:hypothetical protein